AITAASRSSIRSSWIAGASGGRWGGVSLRGATAPRTFASRADGLASHAESSAQTAKPDVVAIRRTRTYDHTQIASAALKIARARGKKSPTGDSGFSADARELRF